MTCRYAEPFTAPTAGVEDGSAPISGRDMFNLTINGKSVSLERAMTISEFLASKNLLPQMVVVERNYEIVPRERFGEVMIDADDNLEIVQMMAGG